MNRDIGTIWMYVSMRSAAHGPNRVCMYQPLVGGCMYRSVYLYELQTVMHTDSSTAESAHLPTPPKLKLYLAARL